MTVTTRKEAHGAGTFNYVPSRHGYSQGTPIHSYTIGVRDHVHALATAGADQPNLVDKIIESVERKNLSLAKVLIIDDESYVAESSSMYLQLQGVQEANIGLSSSYQSARDRLSSGEQFDIIIADHNLFGRYSEGKPTGCDLITEAISSGWIDSSKTLVIGNSASENGREDFLSCFSRFPGAKTYFMDKPWTIPELTKLLGTHFELQPLVSIK